jgi:Domain of unknown function (DUF4157)
MPVSPIEAHEQADVRPSREIRAPEAAAQDPVHSARALAGRVGNQNFGRIVARMRDGEGILPGGRVHPHVEAAIAAARGAGRPLDRSVREALEPGFGTSLAGVRVHADSALAAPVSATAFTVGNDIHFAPGTYQPHTPAGRELIAHEVAHTIQQRGAPASGPLSVSQPGDALEREAEAVARDVTA